MGHQFLHFDNQAPGSLFGTGGFFNPATPGENIFSNPFVNATVLHVGDSEIRDGVQSPFNRFDDPIRIPQGGEVGKAVRDVPFREEVETQIEESKSERGAAADAASAELVKTATATRESIQDRIDSLTGIFLENRITDEEISRRDTVQADIILSELNDLLSQDAASASARGIRGGGAASAGAAIVQGVGIEARSTARSENIKFQKDFNARLSLAVESIKSNLDAAEAQLNTSLGLAKAQIELGRPINFEVLMAAILDVEAVETGREQFDRILETTAEFEASLRPDIFEFLLGAGGDFANLIGRSRAGLGASTVQQGLEVFG